MASKVSNKALKIRLLFGGALLFAVALLGVTNCYAVLTLMSIVGASLLILSPILLSKDKSWQRVVLYVLLVGLLSVAGGFYVLHLGFNSCFKLQF